MNIEIKANKIIFDNDIEMSYDTLLNSIRYTSNWLATLIEAKQAFDKTGVTEQQVEFIECACSKDRGCINNVLRMLGQL
ncbi:MAG: hypothetical protein WC449_05080 [Candidatus Paceibacterota bacterium]